MKSHPTPLTFACGLAFSVLVAQEWLCRAAEKSESASPGSAAGKIEVAAHTNKARSIGIMEPPPLSAEITTVILSNNIGSVTERVTRICELDLTPTQKAQALLLILPTLNKDGQRQVALTTVKFLDDNNCGLLRGPLTEGKLNRQVLSVFLTDILKRKNRIKLPLLLEVARADSNQIQTEARELLAAYLGQDHGTNWARWDQTMATWLARNPD